MDAELALVYILASVLYTECIAGVIINLIIVAVNLIKWKTMKSLPIGDKILSSLATSRSLFLFIIFLSFLYHLLNLWNNNILAVYIVGIITIILNSTNLWFSTVLCVFYCVKITSYNWKFFIFLKTKISTLVPWSLLASLMISVACGLLFGWFIYNEEIQNLTMKNMTVSRTKKNKNIDTMSLGLLLISCPPFLIFLVADCLLLHSLWMHTRRMRSSGSGFRSPNLETHFSAVKSMSFFLVLQILYFSMTMYIFDSVHNSTIALFISITVTCSPPFLHSLYMIASNSEFKKSFISLFYIISCCAKG
ncbi:taste receptor type 2 member 9-like [Dendropsophus ebraccatus]|uniref:taste receptor type 2 member 9-like n=1 Tax=Dendropsophus ebraccatus TaxID=150705 RepID=UPI0038310F5D